MHGSCLMKLAWSLATLKLVLASCKLENKFEDIPDMAEGGTLDAESRVRLCEHQTDGNYQLTMMTSMVSVPTMDADNALAGVAGHQGFILYNDKCVPVGAFTPEGNGCGVPYEINYFPESPLIIDKIIWDTGRARMDFIFKGEKCKLKGSDPVSILIVLRALR